MKVYKKYILIEEFCTLGRSKKMLKLIESFMSNKRSCDSVFERSKKDTFEIGLGLLFGFWFWKFKKIFL